MSFTARNRRPNYGHARYPRPATTKRGPKKEYIEPSRFVAQAKPASQEQYVPTHMFADFGLSALLQSNLSAKGYVTPSPIQDQAIPAGLQGNDVVGIANTGTGKTAAFAIPVLSQLVRDPHAKAIILAPTRELAQQIESVCRDIAKSSGMFGTLLIGGGSMKPQLQDLRKRPQLIIGTPGRIKDHIEQRTLVLDDFTLVVLDEVDRMLDMGFINDIRFILGKTAPNRQSFFFSATMDNRVRDIIDSFANNPQYITVKTTDTSENVEQNVVRYVQKADKLDKLHNLLIQEATAKVLVFDDTQHSVERLSKELQSRGFKADAIHGGKSQTQRQRALKRFRDNEVTVLVATDVAARGIDVVDITHVINYSTPQSYSDYVHRIGRAGRAGRQGHALTFIEQ